MGPGRSPLRFDLSDVDQFIDECRGIAGQRAGYAQGDWGVVSASLQTLTAWAGGSFDMMSSYRN
jgi:hypothetical protein